MCHIITVLETLRKKRSITNKDVVALAEAQAKDTMQHKKEHDEMVGRMAKLEEDMAVMKTDIAVIKSDVALIVARINSPVEAEREAGQKWNLLVSITKHKAAWVILALVLLSFSFAGDKMAGVVTDIIKRIIA